MKTIHVSIFGFSRGATQARVFANWLIEVCKIDARLTARGDLVTLDGFKLEVDFLGLFDTVAPVGTGNTFGNSWLGTLCDGHATLVNRVKQLNTERERNASPEKECLASRRTSFSLTGRKPPASAPKYQAELLTNTLAPTRFPGC